MWGTRTPVEFHFLSNSGVPGDLLVILIKSQAIDMKCIRSKMNRKSKTVSIPLFSWTSPHLSDHHFPSCPSKLFVFNSPSLFSMWLLPAFHCSILISWLLFLYSPWPSRPSLSLLLSNRQTSQMNSVLSSPVPQTSLYIHSNPPAQPCLLHIQLSVPFFSLPLPYDWGERVNMKHKNPSSLEKHKLMGPNPQGGFMDSWCSAEQPCVTSH